MSDACLRSPVIPVSDCPSPHAPPQTLKAGQPLFFGCDVGKFSNTSMGIMGLDLFDCGRVLGVKKLDSTKTERLQTGESSMIHVMVITAAHFDTDGEPVRYRVENS